MAVIVSALYALFLGFLVQNLVSVQVAPGGNAVTVYQLVRSTNWRRTGALVLLFFIDWVCFLVVFPPAQDFSFSPRDAVLLIAYVCVLPCLALGVLMSLEGPSRCCGPLGTYHVMAALAELLWMVFGFVAHDGSVQSPEVGGLLFVVGLYIAVRLGLAVGYILCALGKGAVREEALAFVGIAVKPALLISLSAIPSAGILWKASL